MRYLQGLGAQRRGRETASLDEGEVPEDDVVKYVVQIEALEARNLELQFVAANAL